MLAKFFRPSFFVALAVFAALGTARLAMAAPGEVHSLAAGKTHGEAAAESATGQAHTDDMGGHGEEAGPRPVFEAEHGTWFNILARNLFATPAEKQHMRDAENAHNVLLKAESGGSLTQKEAKNKHLAAVYTAATARKNGQKLTEEQEKLLESSQEVHYVAKYDFLLYTPLLWGLLAVVMVGAARKARIRPQGKAASSANTIEAAVDAFQNYLIGVMGEGLARKYTPLIASFFFTILVSNWLGLVPGMFAASAQPAIPIAMAIVAFLAVHVIAIKEAGLKSWFMHFVGEPVWLAPLNFPLHLVGELIKPLSLSLRLLCNVFGEEAVVATLAGLAISMLPAWLPIPFQLPMLFLGTFFGFLQALVFSTLLAIYISILATHHDDHDAHNNHGHVEHDTVGGHHQIVAHPSQMTVG